MIESTARAERFEPQTSQGPCYLWEVPQKPVAVRIPFSLIDRLEREAVESFRSLTSKGSEIGGLLLGGVTPGSPLVVSIADYELIACDYSRGPLYRLSDADMSRFQRAMEQRIAGGAGIAGFFRSQTRKGLSLDADDLTFFEARFREPHQIALLVRPFATKASSAGIFIWEGGKVNGETSYLEFPFRSSELGTGVAPLPQPPDGKAGAAPILNPSAPKAAPRGQIVPIASRREISLPSAEVAAPAPEATAPVAAAPAPVVEPKAPPVEDKPAKNEKYDKNAKNDKSSKNDRRNEKAEKAEAPKVEAPKPEPPKAEPPKQEKQEKKAAAAAAVTPAPEKASGGKGVKLLMAAAASIVVFVGLFVYPGVLRRPGAKPAVAVNPQDSSSLQLRVERTAGELLITWNRDSEAIKNASKATLAISDGEQHENVEMDLAQLRNGSIVYSPSSIDTSFKMEVIDKNQKVTSSESVRVLRTRPSPLQDQQAAAATPGSKPAPAAADAKNGAAPAAAAPAEETPAEAPTKLASASKPFRAEPLAQRLRPAAPTDIPEAPTVGGAPAPVASLPGMNTNAVVPAPIAPPSAPVAPAQPSASAQTPAAGSASKPGGQIQQAVLIYRKEAEYPKIAKQTGAKGVVTLNATIAKDGTIKAVKIVSGHPMLVNAAAEAVKQWRYRPTLLNGQPVETDTQILVNFVGER